MTLIFKATLLATALGLSACAGMAEAHRHEMGQGPVATHEAGEHDMQCPMMSMMTPLIGCHGAQGDVDARLASIRTALAITPAQERAWNAYAEAYRAHAGQMAGMMGAMQRRSEGVAPPSIPERFQRHNMMMAQHMRSMQPLRVAIEALYATLSDAQKANADTLRCED